MAVSVYIAAAVGSGFIRLVAESDMNDKTTAYLAKQIDVEEATRIVSENVKYYLPMIAVKVVCDAVVASIIGRQLYSLFKTLWRILKPLLESSWKAFMDGIKKSFSSIQQTAKELATRYASFHTIHDSTLSKNSLTNVISALDYFAAVIVCAETGLCNTVQYELTKYYLEIRGLLRALCEKFNINFLKYVPPPNEESNINGKVKDEPLRYTYEIPLEELLRGTQRQHRITREIREINGTTRTETPTYTIDIVPGCKENHVICLTEVGDRDPINIPADLLVTIRAQAHPSYKRQDADLIFTKVISYAASRSGNSVQIPLLDGRTASVNPGKIIDNDTELIVRGHGLPDPDNTNARGRLLVRFDIEAPTNQIHCDAVIDEYD